MRSGDTYGLDAELLAQLGVKFLNANLALLAQQSGAGGKIYRQDRI